MSRYVLVRKFVELTGYTQQAIYTKINQGVWAEGKQFVRSPDRRIQIDMEAYERWVEEGRLPAPEPVAEPEPPKRRGRRLPTLEELLKD
jgi:hypothetical protein